jgi:hypothetical protein
VKDAVSDGVGVLLGVGVSEAVAVTVGVSEGVGVLDGVRVGVSVGPPGVLVGTVAVSVGV